MLRNRVRLEQCVWPTLLLLLLLLLLSLRGWTVPPQLPPLLRRASW
jgi:hypothetical protein